MGNASGKPVVFTDDVNLNHFRLLRVVGKGAFGKVRVVERKDTGLTFALKYIRKDEVVRSESVRNIVRERRMLEHLNHPFICNLRYSFQDVEYMYLVVDLMTGGDLRFHISRKTFTEEAVRFWIAELGCALRYVHKQGIVHRDVKPDNVLLDSEGHVHLADFNVASDLVPGRPLTSKSGTLAYLAPEVYAGTGYDAGVDWWSLGVTFYECIYGKRPFEGNNQQSLSISVRRANPNFPVTSPPVSMVCMHAISSALEPDPSKRMGSASFESFTDNPFFRPIDFEALQRKELEPIFVPSSDKTNFDATYDLEELLLEEAPLEARARKQKPREALKEDATEKEIREDELFRMIETEFLPFDYTIAAYEQYKGQGELSPRPIGQVDSPAISPSVDDTEAARQSLNLLNGGSELNTQHSNTLSDGTSVKSPTRQTSNRQTGQRPPNFSIPNPIVPPPVPTAPQRNLNRQQSMSKVASGSGGLQVVLSETSNWSELAKQDATLPADAKDLTAKPNGMLGFLNRKKGRSHSPKPQERGVLGKEGARVILSS